MNPQENEVPSLPTQIDWPQKIDSTTEQRIKLGFRNDIAHEVVLDIMADERNKVNDSFSPAVSDELVDEVISYGHAIDRIRRGFELLDDRKLETHVYSGIRARELIGGKSSSVNDELSRNAFFTELQHDRDLIKQDGTGFALADALINAAREESRDFKGTTEAVKRYKALYSVTNPYIA